MRRTNAAAPIPAIASVAGSGTALTGTSTLKVWVAPGPNGAAYGV
jgi:hypothetical protein